MAEGALIETATDIAPPSERTESTVRACVYIPCGVPCGAENRIHQGEIVSGLFKWVRGGVDVTGRPMFNGERQEFAIVMTQDCDLEQDHKERFNPDPDLSKRRPGRLVPSILFCEMENVQKLSEMGKLNTDDRKKLRQNNSFRYHFLRAVNKEDDATGQGVPELGIDFIRYFTLPTDEVYRQLREAPFLRDPPVQPAQRRCQINESYREHLQQRFLACLGRVSLDIDHHVDVVDSGHRIRNGSLHGWRPAINS